VERKEERGKAMRKRERTGEKIYVYLN